MDSANRDVRWFFGPSKADSGGRARSTWDDAVLVFNNAPVSTNFDDERYRGVTQTSGRCRDISNVCSAGELRQYQHDMAKTAKILKLAWIVVCLLVSVVCVATYNPTTSHDNDIVLYLVMIVLAFPSAYLVVFLYSGVQAAHVPPLPPRIEMSLLSVGFIVVGYLQWFVLAPWIIRETRRVRAEKRRNSSALLP